MVKRLTSRSPGQILLAGGTLLLSLAILGFLLYRERVLLLQIQWRFDPLLITGAFLAYLFGLGIAILVWADLMQRLGSTLPYTTHIEYFCLSHLAKRLPGTLWYIAGRTYLYKQAGESMRLVTFASSVEMVIMILSGVLTSLLFIGYALAELTHLPWWGWSVLTVLGLLLLHPLSLRYWIRRFNIGALPTLAYRYLLFWLCLYTLPWVVGGVVLYAICNAVTVVPLSALPYLIGSWSLVGTLSFLVFFLPSNLGFSEVGLSLLLATLVPSALAVVVAVVNRIIVLIYEIVTVAGILLLIRLARRPSRKA
jgi:hypothetical protein